MRCVPRNKVAGARKAGLNRGRRQTDAVPTVASANQKALKHGSSPVVEHWAFVLANSDQPLDASCSGRGSIAPSKTASFIRGQFSERDVVLSH